MDVLDQRLLDQKLQRVVEKASNAILDEDLEKDYTAFVIKNDMTMYEFFRNANIGLSVGAWNDK